MHTETPRSERSALFARLVEIGGGSPGDGSPGAAETLYDRHGVLVVRVGDVAVKAHQPDRELGPEFGERIRLAAALPGILLGPDGPPVDAGGRTVTVAPYGKPVDPARELPWEDGARLLAALHRVPVPDGAPSWGRPERVARLVGRLGDGPAEDAVRRAFAGLPAWIRGEEPEPPRPVERIVHGDWHLGQMVRPRDGGWRLIDIEDLGRGDPAWDLARPAALYCGGVLDPADWERFLGAYRAAGGPAVPADGDPWTNLEVPARSLAIQIAATCVQSARKDDRPLDGPEEAMIDACRRMASTGIGGEPA
ncbi:phosphotransferase family protein [Actinomadura sp. WMMB 499]|uniref:phosphotransferase family protein n=1 Tax=Actinomadura sp. WMMB 499 TaxID=1219491 RepID=UPI001243CF07|nr:phosphotransferase [Actinomadura sp. WMMB 499]QFG20845.1 aminoglycoside phosphotransferase family protein [Actinomadura sp. WMMB 499]